MRFIRKHFSLTRAGMLKAFSFRSGYLMNLAGNIIYMIIVYCLWRAIFSSVQFATISGMDFQNTVLYLFVANAILNLIDVNLVWNIGEDIKTGAICVDLLKPMSYPVYAFFKYSGNYIINFFSTFLLTMLICYAMFPEFLPEGIQIILFSFCLLMGIIINFCVEFIVATICVYAESIWGINIFKDVIISLLSGTLVPLDFYPDWLLKIVNCFPFRFVYHNTIKVLLEANISYKDYPLLLGKQCLWTIALIIMMACFWKKASASIMVNGG